MHRENYVSPRLFEARGPFSHAVKVSGAQTLIFTATMTALDEQRR